MTADEKAEKKRKDVERAIMRKRNAADRTGKFDETRQKTRKTKGLKQRIYLIKCKSFLT
jgi:hypothetical protein